MSSLPASVLYEDPPLPHAKAVENASFVHLRLGDLLVAEEQFGAAATVRKAKSPCRLHSGSCTGIRKSPGSAGHVSTSIS